MYRMSTKTHGLIDYVAGAAFMALPRLLGMRGAPAYLLHGAGAAAAAYSFFTNYERGVVRAIPMKGHLALDALSGGMLLGAAAVLDDEDDDVRGTLAGIGLFEIAAALTTETRSGTELRAELDERNRRAQLPVSYANYEWGAEHREAREREAAAVSEVSVPT
jgi:hypothetical protein